MNLSLLRGMTLKREKEFAKLNISDTGELVRYFPRGYLDMTSRASVRDLMHNDVALVAARVTAVEPVRYTGRMRYFRARLQQDGDFFYAVFFNMPYLAAKLKREEYLFYGRVQNKFGQVTLVNPTFEPLERNVRLKGIVPVYPLKGSLTQRIVRDSVAAALEVEELPSAIPEPLVQRHRLMPLKEAYRAVHAPASKERCKAASERIALEEYFLLVTAFRLIKGSKNAERKNFYSVTRAEVAAFEARFPFSFTAGQRKAVEEIYSDLTSPRCMNRLLQGDVGSGKTAVALSGVFMAVQSGFQAAYLSPTEVLAAQNYALLQKVFPERRVAYLAGGTGAKEKREIKQKLAQGEIDILCGTHAILQGDVTFQHLAFCVCDEQHRFGVSQRSALSEKGELCDVLVMSATPIPRTLSLIFYGDLDITSIYDKPQNRLPVKTSIIPAYKYDDMLSYIAREAKAGRQAYFVCAKIDDDEGEITSVTELFEELKLRLPTVRFGLLHGRMKDREKSEIMQAFKQKQFDCLVSTTVIEVGVDVPSATIIVIYNAERFGLSQLHQLRGRVGRGSEQSYCFLLPGSDGDAARERLNILKTTNDGFALSEKDLQLRGSGDFFGTRQSGKILREIKNLQYGTDVIFLAKRLSDEALEGDSDPAPLRAAAFKKYESLKDVVLN